MNCKQCDGKVHAGMEDTHYLCRPRPAHWLLMGGLTGCMPSHMDAFSTKGNAINDAGQMYDDVRLPAWTDGPQVANGRYKNRFMDVRSQLQKYEICYDVGYGDPKYDLCYVQVVRCECDTPWLHNEDDRKEDWEV